MGMRSLSRCSCLHLLLTAFNLAFSQHVPSAILCSHGDALPQRFGQIIHKQDNVGLNRSCELHLPAPSSSYMIIEGIFETSDPDGCTSGTLSVDGNPFCVTQDQFDANSSSSERPIQTSSNSADFKVSYYDTVFRCGYTPQPQVSVTDSVWSGVISSRVPGRLDNVRQPSCVVTVTGLPSESAIRIRRVDKFRPATLMVSFGKQNKTVNAASGIVEILTDDKGEFDVHAPGINNEYDYISTQFLLIYEVIKCGDIPGVKNATYEEVTTPYLPGSTTVRYQCMENYQFTGGSTINCQKNGSYASWTNGVKCIPVPWCVVDPVTIANSIPTVVTLNRTMEYTCKEGYESPYGTNSTLVSCSSTDNETIPWTWNDTNIQDTFSCTPVQCNVSELTALANVTISTTKEPVVYMETVDYECDEGFTELTEEITCQSNKNWSTYQLCEEVQCSMPEFINANASNFPLTPLTYRTVLNISCNSGYQLLNGDIETSIICTAAGSWNATLPKHPNSDVRVVKCEKIPGTTGTEPQVPGTVGPVGLTEMQITLIASVPTGVLFIAAVVIVAVCCVRKNQNQPSESKGKSDTEGYDNENLYFELERPDVVASTQVNNHSIGAYDTVELETPSGPAANGFKKSSNKPSKKSKIKTNGTAVAESSANGAGPNDLYTAVTPKMKPKKTKPIEPPTAAEPIYEPAPAVPDKHHGEQEPDLVENDLYEQTPGYAAGYATGTDDVQFVDSDIYDQSGPPPLQSSDNVAFVDNDLYDFNR